MTINQKNKSLCADCDSCCHYVATEIDKPTTVDEVQNIYWFLLHKNIGVYIGFDNKWYLEFITPCRKLKNKLCGDYFNRPQICRDYNQKTCPQHLNEATEKNIFIMKKSFWII